MTDAIDKINDKMIILFLRNQARGVHEKLGVGKGPENYKEWAIADRFEELLAKEKELEELKEEMQHDLWERDLMDDD